MNELKHLAIIMDGNGRWAKKHGWTRTKGHESGANVVEEICKFCINEKIEILSIYAFSTENWKRPQNEVAFLMQLLLKFLRTKRQMFLQNGIRFNTIGEISVFDNELKNELDYLKNITKQNIKLKLNLAINYGAKDEIIRAVKKLQSKNLTLNEENLINCLDESCEIDLLIRTGGDIRISNFMLLQAAYAELAFTDTLWPDFSPSELKKIVENFKLSNRRFGGL